MPNLITWAAKQRYSDYGEIPDDDLTLRYAEAHPQYLSDPEFKADYDRIMRSKQAAVPQPAPEPEAGVMESVARRAYGGLNVLGGALWKGGEYVSRAVGADDTAEEARLNYEYAKAEADAQRAKSAQTGIGKYAGMVAEALPSILPAIAVAPAGLAGMAIASGVTGGASTLGTAEDAYKLKYLREGFSEEEASAKARISALAPAAASGLATGLITRGFGAKGVEALASQAVTKEAAKKLITQTLPVAIFKGATSEAIEEGVDQAAQAVIERMSYNPDLTLAEAVEQIAQAAFVGGALGGGVAGLRHPGEVRQAQAIVAQERAETAAAERRQADIAGRVNAAVDAAQRQQRIAGMTDQERLLEEQGRIEAEYEPIRLAQHEIDDKIRAEAVAKFQGEERDKAVYEANEESFSERGILSQDAISRLMEEADRPMSQEEKKDWEIRRAVAEDQERFQAEMDERGVTWRAARRAFRNKKMSDAQVVANQAAEKSRGTLSQEELASIKADLAKVAPTSLEAVTSPQHEIQKKVTKAPIPYPFTSQPQTKEVIPVAAPSNVRERTVYGQEGKKVETPQGGQPIAGQLSVKQPEFPATRQIEAQPLPKPYKPDVGIQQAILEETGYSTLAPGLESLTSANKPKPTPLKTAKKAAADRKKERRLPPGAAMSLGESVESGLTPEERIAFNKASSNAVAARNPELAVAAVRLKNGAITAEQYADIIDRVDPFTAKGAEPIPSKEKILEYIGSNAQKRLKVYEDVEDGKDVEVRIDIPTFNTSSAAGDPVYAITVHDPAPVSGKKVEKTISHLGIARVLNPKMIVRAISGRGGPIDIATGHGKFPLATVAGKYKSITSLPSNINNPRVWTEVSFNPIRSSYFVDVRSKNAVTGGSEAIMVGSRVFVKNAQMEARPTGIVGGVGKGSLEVRYGLGEDARALPSGDHAMIKTVAKDAAPDESVDVVHDPDLAVEGRIVEGYVDDNGRIVLNSAAPRMSDPAHVRMVVREERAHRLLNSDEGKEALNKFVGRLTPSEKAELQAEGYVQAQGETAGEYDVRLHNEFIAKQARENTPQWRGIVDRVRGWLSQFGLKLSNAEVARAILRKLNDSRASSYSISSRKAGLTAKLKSQWIAQYSIVDGLQEALAAASGSKVTFRLSKMFERVAGATGKAEAKSIELRQAVGDKIVGRENEFSQMASLNAALSRLLDAEGWRQRAAKLKAGKQDAEVAVRVKAFEDRANRIGTVRHDGELMTIPTAQKLIADMTARLKGDGSWAQVQEALAIYKTFMDADADLKYGAGLISESKWKHFKRADRFYMPYINMSVREDAPAYSGLKGRVGQISAEDKYKTALDAADHLFLSSYRHADMNRAKLQLKKMAEYSKSPHLAEVVSETAASDNVISGLQDGKPFYIKTDADTVAAVNFHPNASNALIEAARTFSSVQRFGATTASASFQLLNLVFSDIPNLALMSKAGIRNPADALSFIGSVLDGFAVAYGGNFGEPSKAYLDFLKSGAAGGSLQSQIDSVTADGPRGGVWAATGFIGKFARSFEETTKIAGYKRLLKDAGVDSVSKLSVSDATNLIAEVRNFSGSPDFAVSGSLVNSAKLGTWLIFVPAALRGNATTISRLLDTTRSGRTEYEREAARGALIKAGFFIGLAAYSAYALNNLTDEMREDYDRIPEDEKRNNFMIPTDSYFTAADGSQVREFARIPKRGVVKILANTIEDSMEYFRKTDSEHFGKMLTGAVESIVPLDISGKTPKERLSGAASSLNPVIKVPLEYATGHNFFRRSRIIPRRLEKAETSEQYTERTNDNVKVIATAIGISPLDLRNALDGMTGGMTAGLLPEKAAAGDRGGISGVPVLSRFVRSARQESQDEGFITELQEKQATASVKRFREADTFVKEQAGVPIREAYEEAVRRYGPENRDIVEKVRELLQKRERGITVEDDRVLQLSPPQRAEYILKQYARTPEQGRKEYILSLSKKHILTPDTRREMFRRGFRWD